MLVDRMGSQLVPEMMDGIFRQLFPGQIPEDPGMAESLDGGSIELEGHPLIPIETGHTDTAESTSLHVPSIGLIAAGDVVYNGPRALFDAMIELYPDRANPGSLWRGANAAKSGAGNGSPGPVTRPAPDEQP